MKILIQDAAGVRSLEEGFASESELQIFLRDYAPLIPVDEMGSERLPIMCVGFEVNVSNGSQDLLYVDPRGMLTVVETKLRRNPEVRREVVGQILEYAADAVLWTRSDIEERAARFFSGPDCPNDLRDFSLKDAYNRFAEGLGFAATEVLPYEAFIECVRANLERGNIRLIIAVDEIHPALLRTVEFVNRFSERFEIYLFQLKRFHDSATKANIFVPALFGRVSDAVAERKRPHIWNRDSFLQQVADTRPVCRELFERLISFCEDRDATSWGRGATWSTFGFHVQGRDDRTAPAFGGSGAGKILLDFKTLLDRLDPDLVEQYRERLRSVPGIPREAVDTPTWREIDVMFLGNEETYMAFLDAVHALQAAAAKRHTPK